MPEDMPHRLAESVPENMQDRMFEQILPAKWIRTYGQRTADEKPDRIQNRCGCASIATASLALFRCHS